MCYINYFMKPLISTGKGGLVISGIINQRRIVLEQILYGTLSGGVVVAQFVFYLWVDLIVGTLSGAIAIALLSKLKPVLIGLG